MTVSEEARITERSLLSMARVAFAAGIGWHGSQTPL
jgi:hypothetical protein